MDTSVSSLTQSKYYSPAFNAAIFDGPIRIYFAQYQEPQALKIYFLLQEQMKNRFKALREIHRREGRSVFIMLYPSAETLMQSFDSGDNLSVAPLGGDMIIGLREKDLEGDLEALYREIDKVMFNWDSFKVRQSVEEAVL